MVQNPLSGECITFPEQQSTRNGDLLRFEWSVRPQGPLPDGVKRYPGHAHPFSEERIRIVNGKLWLRSGGVENIVLEGQEVVVPPRTPHSWWNIGDSEVQAIVEFRPAGEMRSFFETTFGLAQDGKLQKGFETMLRYAVICHDFKDEIRVLKWSERWGVFLFWPLGKLLGYSSNYSGMSVDVPEPDR